MPTNHTSGNNKPTLKSDLNSKINVLKTPLFLLENICTADSGDVNARKINSLIYIILFTGSSFAFIAIDDLLKFLSTLLTQLEEIYNHIIQSIENFSNASHEYDIFIPRFDITKILNTSVLYIILIVALLLPVTLYKLYIKYNELRPSYTGILACYTLPALLALAYLLLHNKILFIFFLTALFSLAISINPRSQLPVYKNIYKYIIYIYEVFSESQDLKSEPLQKSLYKFFAFIVLIYCTSPLISNLLGVPAATISAIIIPLVSIAWVYSISSNKPYTLLKKLILISIAYIIAAFQTQYIPWEINILTPVLVAIYFALDRYGSLIKELKDLVKKESILYYADSTASDIHKLSADYIDTRFILKSDIGEKSLVQQIIIRDFLDSKSSDIQSLIEKYKSLNYNTYTSIVDYLGYKSSQQYSENTLADASEVLSKFFDGGQEVYVLDSMLHDYLDSLYASQDYEKYVNISEEYLYCLSPNEIKNLIYSLDKLGETKKRDNYIRLCPWVM